MLHRMWRTWRAKVRLTAPMRAHRVGTYFARDLHYPELRQVLESGGPELPPYHGLSALWDEHAAERLPDYPTFLAFLARERGFELRSVLDLACGTGRLSERLLAVAGEVVGVDASPDMLAVAEERLGGRTGLAFVRGDFRDFALGRQFDAAVCVSNSLNYVADRGELGRVFAAVGRHLKPGGLFVFDTITEYGMRVSSGLFLHAQVGDRRFALRFSFDDRRRTETTRVILAEGIETHHRVPVGLSDVRAAVAGTGLAVDDCFSTVLAPWHPGPSRAAFFVLTRRG